MKLLHIISVVILAGTTSLVSAAEVYKWVEPDGAIVYSDQPQDGAEKVELRELSKFSSKRSENPPPSQQNGEPQSSGSLPYQKLLIARPGNEETVINNNGDVMVEIELKPALKKAGGHSLSLFIDGFKVAENLKHPSFTLNNVDRGKHTVQVQVVDASGQPIQSSAASVFFMRRFSSQFNPR